MKPYQLGLYEKAMPEHLSWLEKLEATKASGFDFLEMSIDETDAKLARLEMSDQELAELQHAMARTGVYIRTICLSGHRKYPFGAHDEATRRRSLDIMEKAVLLAWRLGVRIIQLAGYDVYYEEGDDQTRAWFLQNLYAATRMAATYGIVLGFETMETPFMDTVGKAMDYVHKVGSPYLGVYPDTGNLTNASLVHGHLLRDDIATGQGHVFAVHLKETLPGVYREQPFGTGHTDFVACARQFYAMGVRVFTGEFWYVGAADWQQELADANRFLRERIEKGIGA